MFKIPVSKISYNWILPKLCLCAFLLVMHLSGYSKQPLILKDELMHSIIDSNAFEEVMNIGPGKFKKVATPSKYLYINNPLIHNSYWYKLDIKNENDQIREWLLVSYNYSINEIDVLIADSSGKFQTQIFRDTMEVYDRKPVHKQPVFYITILPHETKTIYIRVKNESSYNYIFAIFSNTSFISHFLKEYLWFGLFYGFMFFVLLYCLFNAIIFKDYVIFLYACFIGSQVFHMMFRDGSGLFFFPFYPEYADLYKTISRGVWPVALLFYTTYSLKINPQGWFYKTIMAVIFVRVGCIFFLLHDTSKINFHLELLFIVFCTAVCIKGVIKGNNGAIFMATGLMLLTIAYFIYWLGIVEFPSISIIGFFGLYYGVALESIIMTVSLTKSFKQTRVDSYRKEQMNKELEYLVEERTKIISTQNLLLEDQSKELNLFLYSTSHDLAGPLKSIQGLCNMGKFDKEADHEKIYELINNKLKNLESNINDLNLVSTLRKEEDHQERIDFETLHRDMISKYADYPGCSQIEICLEVQMNRAFLSEFFAVRCIYQNIFENAVKYRDREKKSFINISIAELKDDLFMVFEDNGQGIDQEHMPQIFNMFYRANENSKDDTGLGLYIVKLAVLKLGGDVVAESTKRLGTKVTVKLPLKYKKSA